MKLFRSIRARPSEIDWFERLAFLSLSIDVVLGAMTWSDDTAALGVFALAGVYIFALMLFATLILLVSRRASRTALAVLAGFTVAGLYFFVIEEMVLWPTDHTVTLSALSLSLQLGALVLAGTSPARRWFKPNNAPFDA